MYGYIYKTTNLINNKIYIGQKHSDKFLGNKYLGSGKKIKLAIEKYGEKNFKVELIEEVNLKEEMDRREIYWIKYYKSTNKKIGYNLSEGGNVNRTLVGENNGFYKKRHSEESRKKMSEHNPRYMLGKHHSEEIKKKIGLANKGKILSEETKQKLRDNAKNNDNYGMKNKHLSNEAKQKISLLHKGKPSKCKNRIHITNDIIDKMVNKEELGLYLSQGWRLGRKKFSKEAYENISKEHKYKTAWNKNTTLLNNGIINKFVKKDEIQFYINQGWDFGLVHKLKI